MNVKPEIYNEISKKDLLKSSDTSENIFLNLLDDIDQGSNEFRIVVDVGCGTGSATQMMASRVNVGHIYAIDVDEEMIAFAKQNHSKDNITYWVQDFGAEFDGMAQEVKALEGQVDLIVSHNCLHWIDDKERVANNIYRLLTKGAKFWTSVHCANDVFADLSADEKVRHEREWMKVPALDVQHNQWSNAFKSVGFDVIIDKRIERTIQMNLDRFRQNFLPPLLKIQSKYFVDTSDEDKRKALNNSLTEKWLSKRFTDESTGVEMVVWNKVNFQFVMQK